MPDNLGVIEKAFSHVYMPDNLGVIEKAYPLSHKKTSHSISLAVSTTDV